MIEGKEGMGSRQAGRQAGRWGSTDAHTRTHIHKCTDAHTHLSTCLHTSTSKTHLANPDLRDPFLLDRRLRSVQRLSNFLGGRYTFVDAYIHIYMYVNVVGWVVGPTGGGGIRWWDDRGIEGVLC